VAPFQVPVFLKRYKYLSITAYHSKRSEHTWPAMIPIEQTQSFIKSAMNISFNDETTNLERDLLPGKNLMLSGDKTDYIEKIKCIVQLDLFPPSSDESEQYAKFMEYQLYSTFFRDPQSWIATSKYYLNSKS